MFGVNRKGTIDVLDLVRYLPMRNNQGERQLFVLVPNRVPATHANSWPPTKVAENDNGIVEYVGCLLGYQGHEGSMAHVRYQVLHWHGSGRHGWNLPLKMIEPSKAPGRKETVCSTINISKLHVVENSKTDSRP